MRWIPACTAVALVVATTAAAAANTRPGIRPAQRELIVQRAYETLASRTAMGGKQLGFRISNSTLIEPPQFDEVLWLDIATLPGGDMIDMVREAKAYNGVTEAVVYRPAWRLGTESFLDGPEGQSLAGMTIEDVLAAIAVDKPEAAGVIALTTYDVEVVLEGRSRTYKAAVLWLPARRNRDATLYFLDHITQGLEEAVREPDLAPRVRPGLGFANKADVCVVSTKNKLMSKREEGYAGHLSGGMHWAAAAVTFQCSCASDCTATCIPTFTTQTCADSGGFTTDACHRMATDVALDLKGASDGTVAPPACAAGLGCIKKTCLFCACGLAVEVEIQGTSVSFESSGAPDWTGNLTFSWQCAACRVPLSGSGTPIPPSVPLPAPEPEPGGGGGSNCCWWRTSCYTDEQGVYNCTPTTCGQWGC